MAEIRAPSKTMIGSTPCDLIMLSSFMQKSTNFLVGVPRAISIAHVIEALCSHA